MVMIGWKRKENSDEPEIVKNNDKSKIKNLQKVLQDIILDFCLNQKD